MSAVSRVFRRREVVVATRRKSVELQVALMLDLGDATRLQAGAFSRRAREADYLIKAVHELVLFTAAS